MNRSQRRGPPVSMSRDDERLGRWQPATAPGADVGEHRHESALDRADVVQRYVPLLKSLAGNIAASVPSLQE
jgi:hypothetical protein